MKSFVPMVKSVIWRILFEENSVLKAFVGATKKHTTKYVTYLSMCISLLCLLYLNVCLKDPLKIDKLKQQKDRCVPYMYNRHRGIDDWIEYFSEFKKFIRITHMQSISF